MIKKMMTILLTLALSIGLLTGCGNRAESFDPSQEIGVISREEGSGTRGAFVELFGVEQKDEAGEKVDYTTPYAIVTKDTSVMMTTVAGDLYAIGYISLGSLNDTVKALRIDGVEPTVENIKTRAYTISRPFHMVTAGEVSPLTQDFMDYVLSTQGQQIVENNKYIPLDDTSDYTGGGNTGKLVITGSSSVTPVMEKLREGYLALNPNVTVEIQQTDSSSGITDAIDGTCQIGMASRDLKDSEINRGAVSTVLALDGIAVIVNKQCPVTSLTTQQVRDIYTGGILHWDEVIESAE